MIFLLRNYRKLQFYNYETGEPYPYWFGVFWHLVVAGCCVSGVIVIILAVCKLWKQL